MRLRSCLPLVVLGACWISCDESKQPTILDGLKKLCSDSMRADEEALIAAGRAIITTAVADMCSRPPCGLGSIIDQALLGEEVKVLPGQLPSCVTELNAFLQIETASGYRGFISISALKPIPVGKPAYREGQGLWRVSTRLASVYQDPDVTKRKPTWQIPVDVALRVEPFDPRWFKVELPSGNQGYVQRGDLAELPAKPEPSTAACVIEHARMYSGTPYLWGGRSTLGIDCSGLVSNAFAACGIVPPRDAGPQAEWTKLQPIAEKIEQLLPGDLLFFGGKKTETPRKISHVGIYVGQGRFIHATTHDHPVVQESALSDEHWTEIWLGARRYPF